MIRISACAKINIILEIIEKRADGYHELASVMQAISLFDELVVKRTSAPGIVLDCPSKGMCSVGENLVYKAAMRFFREIDRAPAVAIDLRKNIPVSAGLGGGSSDAAATLKALNQLWGGPLDPARMRELASDLGSDVPFFLAGGTALATGRGECILPLPYPGKYYVLLINAGLPVPTAEVYANLNLDLTTQRCIPNILPVFLAGRMSGTDLMKFVRNDLQATVIRLYPEIQGVLDWIAGHGAESVCVSGSGGTVLGLYRDSKTAADAARKATGYFHWVYLAETIEGCEYVSTGRKNWGVGKWKATGFWHQHT